MTFHCILVFLAIISVVYSTGPCEQQRQQNTDPGVRSLACSSDGNFEAKQCIPGSCWCVDRQTGVELPGSRKVAGTANAEPVICHETLCQEKRRTASNQGIGGYVPSCTADGKFTAVQHGPGGFAWCVDTTTGVEMPGSRVRAPEAPTCS